MFTESILFLITISQIGYGLNVSLRQVVVLGRHNIRTPLTSNLEQYTPNEWPIWQDESGYLTKKGALLENYMGEYFYDWMNKEGLLPNGCPEKDSVFIYANTKPRTKDTAKAFAATAFPKCNIEVYYKNMTEMDPIFDPIIHNNTDEFKQNYFREMEKKLTVLNLTASFEELDKILDIRNSSVCKEASLCDLLGNNTVLYAVGDEPHITGPLSTGNSIVDTFIMSYYDGNPIENVAWGKITEPQQWELITEITRQNQNVRFVLPNISKDFTGPLLNYMADIFIKTNDPRKFILLVGHDSNLSPLISALNFKPFTLVNQYEPYPIGSKLTFQRWTDEDNKDYLKVEYIYPSWMQLRDGVKISMQNPPSKVLMELNGCTIIEGGLCLWDDFINVISDFI